MIVDFAVATSKVEAIFHVVRKSARANLVERLRINNHHNVTGNVKAVSAVKNLTSNTFSLPLVPIWNVVKIVFTLGCLEITKLGEFPGFTACTAGQMNAFAIHLSFLLAVWAFV